MSDLVLNRTKVAATIASSRLAISDIGLDVMEDYIRDNLVHRLSGYVLSDHLCTDHKVVFRDYPASWWQHTKAVHFPTISRWLRRPPRYKRDTATVVVETTAIFPEARVQFPTELGLPRFIQQPHIDWVREGDDPRGES